MRSTFEPLSQRGNANIQPALDASMEFAGRLLYQFQGESIWPLSVLTDVCEKFQKGRAGFARDKENTVPVSCYFRFVVVQIVVVV